MKCPKCGLYNPDTAMRCDCGYDFDTNTMEDSYIARKAIKPSTLMVSVGWLSAILGGVVGIIISCKIAFGKSAYGLDGYKYDAQSRKMGKAMFILSIIMFVFWLLIGGTTYA